VSLSTEWDGVNGGQNAGRFCWAVVGTFRRDTPQGTHAEEVRNCIGCRFFKQVQNEEERDLAITFFHARTHLERQKHKHIPNWASSNKQACILKWAESLHKIAKEMFLKDGTHVHTFFLFNENGPAAFNKVQPRADHAKIYHAIRQVIKDNNLYGVIHFGECWAYFPKGKKDHTAFPIIDDETMESDLRDKDKTEVLYLRMESRDGACVVYIDEIVRHGKNVSLGEGKVIKGEERKWFQKGAIAHKRTLLPFHLTTSDSTLSDKDTSINPREDAAMATKTKTAKPKVISKPELPTKELTAWLKGRNAWNHNEWVALLTELRTKGYSALTDTQEGQDAIGKFLEANRSK